LKNDEIVVSDSYKPHHKKYLTWIKLRTPEKKTLEQVARICNIDISDIEDFLEDDERGRVEMDDYVQIVYNTPKKDLDEIEEIAIFVFNNLIVTVEKEPILPIKMIKEKLHNKQLKELFKEEEEGFLYYFLNEINEAFERRINEFKEKTIGISSKEVIDRKVLSDLYKQNITLIHYNQALLTNADTLKNLKKIKYKHFNKDSIEYFEDLHNDTLLLIDKEKIQREIITNIFNAQSILSNQKTNEFVNKLTVITIILMIPTLISGIFGMNFKLPFQNHPHAFGLTIFIMIGFALASLLLARKLRWI
jgi:magnesium transporter